MNCEQIRMQIPEYLPAALEPGQRAWLESHVGDCAGCRGELDQMSRVWRSLEPIAEDVPTSAMRTRFRRHWRRTGCARSNDALRVAGFSR